MESKGTHERKIGESNTTHSKYLNMESEEDIDKLYKNLLYLLNLRDEEVRKEGEVKKNWSLFIVSELLGKKVDLSTAISYVESWMEQGFFNVNEENFNKIKKIISIQRKVNKALHILGKLYGKELGYIKVDGIIGWKTFQYIKLVQKHLKMLGYYDGEVDGVWGKLTERAYRRFLSDYRKGRIKKDMLERAVIYTDWGMLDVKLTQKFQMFLDNRGEKNRKGKSYCSIGAQWIIFGGNIEGSFFPDSWEFYDNASKYGFFVVESYNFLEDLQHIREGDILLFRYPQSKYKDEAGNRPTHMVVYKDGYFYHIVGDRVYKLDKHQLIELVKKKKLEYKGRAIAIEKITSLRDRTYVYISNFSRSISDSLGYLPHLLYNRWLKEEDDHVKIAMAIILSTELRKGGTGFRGKIKSLFEGVNRAITTVEDLTNINVVEGSIFIKSLGPFQMRAYVVADALYKEKDFWLSLAKRFDKELYSNLKNAYESNNKREIIKHVKEVAVRVLLSKDLSLQFKLARKYLEELYNKLLWFDKEIISHVSRGKINNLDNVDLAYSIALYYHYGNYIEVWKRHYLALAYVKATGKKIPLKLGKVDFDKIVEELKEKGYRVSNLDDMSVGDITKLYYSITGYVPRGFIMADNVRLLREYGYPAIYGYSSLDRYVKRDKGVKVVER